MPQYPTNIVSNTNIPDFNPLASLANNQHASRSNNLRDEVIATQTKVGKDGDTNTASLDYKLKSTASSNPGHKHTLAQGATDVTATTAEVNKLAGLTTTAVELGRVAGVTSAIQTQIDSKAPTSHTHSATDITSGVLNVARLGTGTANSTKYLRGDSTWADSVSKVLPQGLSCDFTNTTGYSVSVISTDYTGLSASNKLYAQNFKSGQQAKLLAYTLIDGALALTNTASTGLAASQKGGLTVCGSYVYTLGYNGSGYVTTRHDLNTLNNATSMTGGYSGTNAPIFSNGTLLYIVTSSGIVTPYTISGTTLTAGSTINCTSISQTDLSIWCDGTYIYQSTNGTTVYRWLLTGGASTKLTDYTVGNTYYTAGAPIIDCGYIKQVGNTTSGIRVTSNNVDGASLQIIPII